MGCEVAYGASDALYRIEIDRREVVVNTERLKKYHERVPNRATQRYMDMEEEEEWYSSDEENVDEDVVPADDPDPQPDDEDSEEGEEPRVIQPQRPTIGVQNEHKEGWGTRGELRCGLDQGNIIDGPGRSRRQK